VSSAWRRAPCEPRTYQHRRLNGSRG
jgi:hypothetical protein